jgi:hypothetical protein
MTHASPPIATAVRRAGLVATLCLIVVWLSMRPQHVQDPDLGWHLRTGEWVLTHGSVPLTDPFSTYGHDRPWVDDSWLFDVLLAILCSGLGLLGAVLYTVGLCVANLLVLHLLFRRVGASVPRAVVLTGLATVALTPLFSPRPWLITILFFLVTLNLLTKAAQARSWRPLFWIPPLFAAWANIHIQFIYGLALVAIYAVDPVVMKWVDRAAAERGAWWELVKRSTLLCACIATTLLNPYGVGLYRPALDIVRNAVAFQNITELHAMDFRHPAHWVVLALVLAAVFDLGRHNLARPLTWLLLFVGVVAGFCATRDIWMPVIVSTVILAMSTRARSPEPPRPFPAWLVHAAVILVGAMTLVLARGQHLSQADLEAGLATEFPLGAVRFIDSGRYEGPLFNHPGWGGFLMWRLPRFPVSIDRRADLHGDRRLARAASTWSGAPGWNEDPELSSAHLVVAPVKLPLATLLATDRRFELVYKDPVAAVFVARVTEP